VTTQLLPLFANLRGRRVLLVGGGPVARSKLVQLLEADAEVRVVAPDVSHDIERAGVVVARRGFAPADLDDVWLAVAAATPAVNRAVAEAAEARRVFVNAVDDPANASVYLGGVVRRGGVTVAISTTGNAPGLTALLRQALDALLPRELGRWVGEARRLRADWKRAGVPMALRRPLLLEALNRLYPRASEEGGGEPRRAADPRRALVSLVGAGPGDPALLTRAAVARLRAADLVLYDALVDERVLGVARRARRFFVGKRAGRHTLTQGEIHALMIRAARRGRRVVRLKGGDPFVFGRGGEEALALAAAGVSFEVVPGVTSAVAAPALAGIPLTHRGLASAFLVVSGHDEGQFADTVSGLVPDGLTLVVLMGMANRAALAARLLDRGWDAATPAALVADGSLPSQDVWRGTLRDVAAGRAAVSGDGPALFVVGQVAGLDLLAADVTSERAQQCL
jgi:uroporphyrin-III C-methyltransferase/precorrin-2 dehydrogenase/sirohydrochlorin ferrochelatase